MQDLRAQLKANEACMVCGSYQHPFVEHENLLSDALGQLQDQQLQHTKNEAEQQQLKLKGLEIQYSKIEATTQQQQGRFKIYQNYFGTTANDSCSNHNTAIIF